jgi:hypothetical protein
MTLENQKQKGAEDESLQPRSIAKLLGVALTYRERCTGWSD